MGSVNAVHWQLTRSIRKLKTDPHYLHLEELVNIWIYSPVQRYFLIQFSVSTYLLCERLKVHSHGASATTFKMTLPLRYTSQQKLLTQVSLWTGPFIACDKKDRHLSHRMNRPLHLTRWLVPLNITVQGYFRRVVSWKIGVYSLQKKLKFKKIKLFIGSIQLQQDEQSTGASTHGL